MNTNTEFTLKMINDYRSERGRLGQKNPELFVKVSKALDSRNRVVDGSGFEVSPANGRKRSDEDKRKIARFRAIFISPDTASAMIATAKAEDAKAETTAKPRKPRQAKPRKPRQAKPRKPRQAKPKASKTKAA